MPEKRSLIVRIGQSTYIEVNGHEIRGDSWARDYLDFPDYKLSDSPTGAITKMKIFHKILPKLLLICCLVFEFIECSRKLSLPTSFPDHNDEEEQNKNSKIGKLVPKRHVPKVENLSPSYWTFHPFPLSDVIDDTEVYSRAITHSQSNISTFACVHRTIFGQSMLLSKERKAKSSYVCDLDKPSTLISFFGKQVMLASGRYFTNVDTTARLDSPNWNCLDEMLSEDELHKDDFIVTGKLVSETEGFLLTSMGLLFYVAGCHSSPVNLLMALSILLRKTTYLLW